MKQDIFEIRVPVVPVRAPTRSAQINFHITGARRVVANLNHRVIKIRSAFGAGKAGMKNPDLLPIRRPELIPFQALMQPDGLKQALGREVILIVQEVQRPQSGAPAGVEVLGRRRHLEIAFAPVMAQSQADTQKKLNAAYGRLACL